MRGNGGVFVLALVLAGCSAASSVTRTVTHVVTRNVPRATPQVPAPTSTSGSGEGPGSHSHADDPGFCANHQCIANFSNGHGYIVQCADGEWSHSGGVSGACSEHGGESASNSASRSAPPASGSGSTPADPTGPLIPGDHNANDASASMCDRSAELGPHADCAVEQQVLQDLSNGRWNAPGSDTVIEGGNTITFNCVVIGNAGGSSQAPIYSCTSQSDTQDWFKFSFT